MKQRRKEEYARQRAEREAQEKEKGEEQAKQGLLPIVIDTNITLELLC